MLCSGAQPRDVEMLHKVHHLLCSSQKMGRIRSSSTVELLQRCIFSEGTSEALFLCPCPLT